MAIIADFPLSHDALAQLKRALFQTLPKLPKISSSHLSEAIAFAFGFKTNAAMQAQLRVGEGAVVAFDSERFSDRLVALGHAPVRDVSDEVRLTRSLLPAQADLGLAPRAPLERCAAYGVRLMRKANGDVFAHHNVAGVVGPCRDEHEAAALACETWDI